MDYEETYYGELIVKTFENIVEKYRVYADTDTIPFIEDPGVPGNSVTSGMSPAAFKSFFNKIKEHATFGRQALQEDDPEKATGLWKKIFGERFPSTISSQSKSTLASAIKVSSLSFPNRPIVPRKPGGFA